MAQMLRRDKNKKGQLRKKINGGNGERPLAEEHFKGKGLDERKRWRGKWFVRPTKLGYSTERVKALVSIREESCKS